MPALSKAGELSNKIEKASGGDHKSKNQSPRNADFDPKGKVLSWGEFPKKWGEFPTAYRGH
jgi:hypothetical protein